MSYKIRRSEPNLPLFNYENKIPLSPNRSYDDIIRTSYPKQSLLNQRSSFQIIEPPKDVSQSSVSHSPLNVDIHILKSQKRRRDIFHRDSGKRISRSGLESPSVFIKAEEKIWRTSNEGLLTNLFRSSHSKLMTIDNDYIRQLTIDRNSILGAEQDETKKSSYSSRKRTRGCV